MFRHFMKTLTKLTTKKAVKETTIVPPENPEETTTAGKSTKRSRSLLTMSSCSSLSSLVPAVLTPSVTPIHHVNTSAEMYAQPSDYYFFICDGDVGQEK